MKQLLKTFLKKKWAALIALAGAALIAYSQKILVPSQDTLMGHADTAIESTDSVATAFDQINSQSTTAGSSCDIFPATAEVSAEADVFADKVTRLQSGYNDISASNPFAKCANSMAAKEARKKLLTIGFAKEVCRSNHQKQLETLQANKSLYYERYLALSKEPACQGLLELAENSDHKQRPNETLELAYEQPSAIWAFGAQ